MGSSLYRSEKARTEVFKGDYADASSFMNFNNLKKLNQHAPKYKYNPNVNKVGNPVEEHELDQDPSITVSDSGGRLVIPNCESKKSIVVFTQSQREENIMETIRKFGANTVKDSIQLIMFSELLTQEAVINYALNQKNLIIEPLLLAQQQKSLTKIQFKGILYLSLTIGDRAWENVHVLLENHS